MLWPCGRRRASGRDWSSPATRPGRRGFDDLGARALRALGPGRVEALSELDRSIALVGARAATGYGEHVTVEASSGLVDRGYAIVSGAAYGIDGAAHRAALASRGTTIAFLAGGLDRFYPCGHEALLARIVDGGRVVRGAPRHAPTKWRFLQRNRLIAAAEPSGRRRGSRLALGIAQHRRRTPPPSAARSARCRPGHQQRPAGLPPDAPRIPGDLRHQRATRWRNSLVSRLAARPQRTATPM